ncbi:MAG: HAMP domain-containing histidine kinase [Colwellia sp.]|nr:HAMP domain-containing histidine kinase [Colwellia sp.]
MSLRSYLFSLIGSLIILLTVSQLTLVYWIDKNLAAEVETQARHLSQQVFNLAFEKIDKNDQRQFEASHKLVKTQRIIKGNEVVNESIKTIEIPPERVIEHLKALKNTSNKIKNQHVVIDLNYNNSYTTENYVDDEAMQHNGGTEELIIHSIEPTRRILIKEFKSIVKDIHNENIEIFSDEGIATMVIQSNENAKSHWISNTPKLRKTSKTESLIQSIQWLLIISAIVALIFAYWLSAQFNKPLKELASGFERLSQGDYQQNVKEQGVKEIRSTIIHFNQMVLRLLELTQAEKQHKEIAHLAELGEVSRGLAHALRNPIHTIGLSLEQLSQAELTPAQRLSLLSTAQNKISHIDKNIKALLTLTTTGITRDEQVPILAVVQDIILEYKTCNLAGSKMQQQFDIDIGRDITLLGDESEIRSILHTLIINACEANTDNKAIRISASIDQYQLKIIVTDNGCGLAESIREQLFQPHISTKAEGAGMGLYIAKRIISLHYHGELTIENNIDQQGCTALACFKQSEVQ